MLVAWPCLLCRTPNLPEDRYCGECGAPPESTPLPPPSADLDAATSLLADVQEAPPGAPQGTTVVVIAGLVAAVAIGVVYHYVTRAFDLMILFPLFAGLAAAGAVKVAAIRGRCRNALMIVAVAAASGTLAYGVRQTLDTLRIQGQLTAYLHDRRVDASDAAVSAPTIGETLSLRSEAGIGFGSRKTFRGAMFWIFLLAEAGLAAFGAGGAARTFSSLAFCGRCRRPTASVPVYRVGGRDARRLVDAVRRQLWREAQKLSDQAAATPDDRADATLFRCDECRDGSIRVDVRMGRGSRKALHAAMPVEAMEALARSA